MATIKKQLTLTFKQPNIAGSYGPYASVSAAHEALSEDQLNVIGMTVGIEDSITHTIEEYWYQGGTERANLVKKQSSEVEANPTGEATTPLNKIKIGDTNYNIPQTDTSNLATKQELQQGLSGKQDTIADLEQIRTRADEGHTALQPSATTGLLKNDGTVDTQTAGLAETALQPVPNATTNNFAIFDENGNIKTSECNEGTFIKGVQQNGVDLQKDEYGKVNVTVQDGEDGLSAFEIAQQQGYTGNVDQWLASLKANIGAFKFVANVPAVETAFEDATTGGIGTPYTSAIDGITADANTASLILLMNTVTVTPAKTYMIATQDDGNSGYEFVYAGNLQDAMPSNVLTEDDIDNSFAGGSDKVAGAESVKVLKETKLDKTYPVYETSQLIATDTQYQNNYYISYNGNIYSVENFGVLGFDCTENQKLLITGSFGGGNSCLGVFKDDNGNVKGLVLQKPTSSPYYKTVVSDYYCEVPSGATKIYVQTNKKLLQNPSCKLVVNTTYRQYSEIILQNETDIDSIQEDLEQLQDDFDESIYTELTIPQTWVNRMVLSSPVVGEAPNFISNSYYRYCYIEGLKSGDVVNAHFRSGSSYKYGAKLKNGVIVKRVDQNEFTLDRTYVVDDTFDAIILNNYTGYVGAPTAEVITTASRISVIEGDITDLQETVNDIIEQGVGGEFNLLCFGNSFTQDTISYIPWLIKECEPNLKLNVYFTYMGGMPISECLAYISNGTVIVLNSEGNPTTKYENHGGWDRIYSYSNGEWVAPEEGTTNYHKSYTLYKYNDGANSWVSQSEPTAASVLAMKNWDLITIQQAGSYNYGNWDYYFKSYVYQIQAELQKQVKHNFTLGYLMTHASYSTSSSELLTRYNGIVQNGTKMLENTPVEILMPYATALQNARTTYLDRFGAGGHLMGDTAHVSDGVGCLTCAYANTMAILDLIGSKKSIVGSQIYPDAAWLNSHNIPAVSSTIEGLSRYNIWLAQQCAVMATKYPLQLTDMVAKGMCGDTEIEIVNDVVYSSNPILSANNGDSWKTTLIAPEGMAINSVNVVMGSTDITSSVYDSTTKEINIPNVSDKITITATTILL